MITITDLTRSARESALDGFRATLPNYPVDNIWRPSRERAKEEFKILGGQPIQHWGAVGAEKLSLELSFSNSKGISIYENLILPSYGSADEQPHLILIAWGNSSEDTFTGRPESIPEHDVTRVAGQITNARIMFELTADTRQVTRVVNTAGNVVNAAPKTVHTVKTNETLGTIASKYGITVDTLSLANPGQPWRPPAGTRLVIPR
jgi:LysM repeat protein